MKLQYSSSAPTIAAGAITQGQSDINGNMKVVIQNSGSTAEQVQGNVASSATDSGNPVKVGGVNNTTQPTLTDGQRGDLQMDTRGNTRTVAMVGNNATLVATAATSADGVATSSTSARYEVVSRNYVFNGATYDRMRGDTTGTFTKAGIGATSTNVYSVNNSFGTATKAAAKASTGNLFSVYCSNTNAAVRYLQIHNKATAPAGTDVPVSSFLIPAGTATAPATIVLDASYFGTNGKYLSTGVSWAISTTNATFTDSATASEHNLEINYI